MQKQKDVRDLDEEFQTFLKKARDYDKLTDERKRIRAEMDIIEKRIAPVLNKMEQRQQKITIRAELCDIYRNCIGLRLVPVTPNCALGKKQLFKLLFKFYLKKFPSQSKDDITNFADASAVFVWENRERKPTQLKIRTMKHKKVKQTTKIEEDEEDEEEDEGEEDDE